MDLTQNTLLITGGGSGIGRGLARAFYDLGNHVIVAGRRLDALQETAEGRPKMTTVTLDVACPDEIVAFAKQLCSQHPSLNCVVNNAGIMRTEDLTQPQTALSTAELSIATNLLGPIRLTTALLPHLLQRPRATLINVSSGLAFVPLAMTPTYCATKAAIHSYTQSLRRQLRHTQVEVLELVPPYVQTDLMDGKNDPMAMPLDAFLAETLAALHAGSPAGYKEELRVRAVDGLRLAEQQGRYDSTFLALNEAREASKSKRESTGS